MTFNRRQFFTGAVALATVIPFAAKANVHHSSPDQIMDRSRMKNGGYITNETVYLDKPLVTYKSQIAQLADLKFQQLYCYDL